MFKNRLELYKQLEGKRNSKLLVYITSDRRGLETKIASDMLSNFVNHLDLIQKTDKISLYLYTRGGDTISAWSLVNLIRNFCDKFEVIIPFNCHSAGTLICLGANNIVMTKQATLGPIDPSTNGPLNPQIPGGNPNARVPVNVEFVNGFFELAKSELNIKKSNDLTNILVNFSNKVHPLVLGQVNRARTQIQMLAKKLLVYQNLDHKKERNIIKFLCSESGSHDYTIYRKEAENSLGLRIEKPNNELYSIIKSIYDDIENELQLNDPYDPNVFIGRNKDLQYTFRRALIESIEGESDVFMSQGTLLKRQIPKGPIQQVIIEDQRTFEGWKHEKIE